MVRIILIAIGIAAIVLVFGGCSEQDPEEARYCEMVSLWKQQAKDGVPINDRAGWPPYRGACK
jgi:hypothetical protein